MEQSPDDRDRLTEGGPPLQAAAADAQSQSTEAGVTTEEIGLTEPDWLSDGQDVLRATRSWVQYGLVGFTILCIIVSAVEGLFGR